METDCVSQESGMEEWRMTCNNDWDELEEIIVGTATSCNIPDPNISILKCQFPEYEEEYIKSVSGYYPEQIIDEQNEELEILSNTLKSLGVKVYRPDTTYADAEIKSPTWHGKNWQYYSPRDLTFIVEHLPLYGIDNLRHGAIERYLLNFSKKGING